MKDRVDVLKIHTTTSGDENDLKQATHLARKMVLAWGMSERFAQIFLGSERKQVFLGEEIAHRRRYSEATAREVDQAVMEILGDEVVRLVSPRSPARSRQMNEGYFNPIRKPASTKGDDHLWTCSRRKISTSCWNSAVIHVFLFLCLPIGSGAKICKTRSV